jgi:thymidylate synthase ThyX
VKIFIKEIANPETLAMLQALYSRSHTSVEEHLKGVEGIEVVSNAAEKKLQDKMKTYYLGYSHSSIGDCGSTTLFIEGVSIIAAKAIQDTPLYSGQESSTRFIEFGNQSHKLKNLLVENYPDFYYDHQPEIDSIIDRSYDFYEEVFMAMRESKARDMNVEYDNVEPNVRRSINAWAFDVGRGFLPSGTTTQLSFHGSLRELRKQFMSLAKHPFNELRVIAKEALTQLYRKYPNSFKFDDSVCTPDEIMKIRDCYISGLLELPSDHAIIVNCVGSQDSIDNSRWSTRSESDRSWNHNMSYIEGNICAFSRVGENGLDYGSWRDLQRHRNGYCGPALPMVIFTNPEALICPWYYNKLPSYLAAKWLSIAEDIIALDDKAGEPIKEFLVSYLVPLGAPVGMAVAYNLQEWDYIFDLRLRDTVHPSLVNYLSSIIFTMKDNGINYFYNKYIDRITALLGNGNNVISLKRGTQTIQDSEGKAISD